MSSSFGFVLLSFHPFAFTEAGGLSFDHSSISRYFQHARLIPVVGVGERGEYQLVYGDLQRQHSFDITLRFTGPVPADYRQ